VDIKPGLFVLGRLRGKSGAMEITDTLYRDVRLHAAGMDTEARTVPASLSSETPVQRWFGQEVLVHSPDAVDLSRAADGLPLLFSHNSDQPIGVVRDVRLDGGKLRGTLHFSQNARAMEVWADVAGGFLRNVSIGYRVNTLEEQANSDTVRVTNWSLLEASVVSVPADPSVGVNRAESTMTDERTNESTKPTLAVSNSAEVLRRERQRVRDIEGLFSLPRYQGPEYRDLMMACIREGADIEQARAALLEKVGSESEPLGGAGYIQTEAGGSLTSAETRGVRVSQGRDQVPEIVAAMTDAICQRAGLRIEKPHAAAQDFVHRSIPEMAEMHLRSLGIRTSGLNRSKLMGEALSVGRRGMIAHGSSDFADLLANVADKMLMVGFMEQASEHRRLCRMGSLSDFKQGKRVALSEFSNLDELPENSEYKYGTLSDTGVAVQLATYGKMFSISRQALVNDDLSAFSSLSRGMAAAAARKEADLVFAVLTGNPTMGDGNSLFDATNHGNYVASGGAAPSVSTFSAARVAMGSQKGPADLAFLNIRPAFLVVPLALGDAARVLMSAEFDPAKTQRNPNPVQGQAEVIEDPRLDADSSTAWYVLADPLATDTIELLHLDGASVPYSEQQAGWEVDGLQLKVRFDVGVTPLDYRGVYKNVGA